MTNNEQERTQAFNKLIDFGLLLVNNFEKAFPDEKNSIPANFLDDLRTNLKTMSITIQNNMGDQINIANSQVSGVGSKAVSRDNQFHQQNNQSPDKSKKDEIAKVLEDLRKELSGNSVNGENLEIIAKLTNAEVALKNNKPSSGKLLKPILKWMINTGRTIGSEILKQYLEQQMGIK